jgi:phytoene desaturase
MQIVVIGSGFGGLAAAIRLQAQGHRVTILEARSQAGGRAGVLRQDGFCFDLGPTIITMPQLIRELFDLAGKRLEDALTLVPLDPFYNVRFPDGSVFSYRGDRPSLIEQIRRFNPADEAGYEHFEKASKAVFDKGFPLMTQPFLQIPDMLRVAPDLLTLQAYRSVAGFANQYLKDPRLRQVFSFHPLLIGGNPFTSTAIYAMIHRLEQEFGIWFPLGGTAALVQSLVDLFCSLGGDLRLNWPVTAIDIDPVSCRAAGVVSRGSHYLPADAVISNVDMATTYQTLIPAAYRRKWTDARLQRLQYSMSLFVYCFGTCRQYPHLAHHEIFLGPRYQALMQDLFQRQTLAKDFSLYLHRPTATDPQLAPPGCDTFYVLSPVPHLGASIDWATIGRHYRDRLLAFLEASQMPALRDSIVSDHLIDPRYFRADLNSYLGSAFSLQPTLFQSAWFRPHNRSEEIPNLYLVGAGTHPGAGIPGTLSSGKIAAQLIATNHREL